MLYLFQDAYKALSVDLDSAIRAQVHPTDIIIFIDFVPTFTKNLLLTIVGLFFLSEFFCITLIGMILSILRENASLFSKNTYKLHVQFTVLLAVQVRV